MLKVAIYLKNGGIIKGVIIEQIPDDIVKIQTKDGSVLIYNFDDISKITKSIPSAGALTQNQSGYKGFVKVGHSFGVGNEEEEDDDESFNHIKVNRLEFTTTHGYQVNPYLFLGLGMGINLYYKDDVTQIAIPMFFNTRINMPTESIVSPYLDIKVGYTAGTSETWEYVDSDSYSIKNSGLYFAPSIGARFAIDKSNAINISVGYTLQKNTSIVREYTYDGLDIEKTGYNMDAITVKLGFEF